MGQVGRGVRPFVLLFAPLGVRAAMSRNGLAVCCASNAAIDGCYALVSIDYLHRPHAFSV